MLPIDEGACRRDAAHKPPRMGSRRPSAIGSMKAPKPRAAVQANAYDFWRFMASKNSSLVLVICSLSMRNSIASVSPIG